MSKPNPDTPQDYDSSTGAEQFTRPALAPPDGREAISPGDYPNWYPSYNTPSMGDPPSVSGADKPVPRGNWPYVPRDTPATPSRKKDAR